MKLEIRELSKKHKERVILDKITLSIPSFRTLAILGPSGSGKSSLLKLIAGLEYPNAGTISLDDKTIIFNEKHLLSHRRSMGIVFQSFNLFPHLTVLENIELPLYKVHQIKPSEARERAMHYLTRFHLHEHAHKKPAHLSGGQSQRVAIVRAFAIQARLYLLDEPTSALDPSMTAEVLDLIYELSHEGASIIFVSHHLGFVKKVAEWIIYLDNGKSFESTLTSQFFADPKTPQAQQFLEKTLKY